MHFNRKVNLLLTIVIVGIMLTPILNRNLNRYVQLSLFLLWFLSSFFINKSWMRYSSKIIIPIIVWQVIEIFYLILGLSSASIGNYLLGFFAYFILMMGLFICRNYNKNEMLTVLFSIVIIVLINVVDNIRLDILIPGGSEKLYRSWGSDLLLLNFAETGFYSAVMMMCCLLFLAHKYMNKKVQKLLYYVTFIICSFFLFFITPRATSCFLYLIAIGYVIIKTKKSAFIYYIFTVLLLIFVLILPSVISFFDSNGNLYGANRLIDRIESINAFLFGGELDSDSSLGARRNLTLMSLDTFFSSGKSLFFGVGVHLQDEGFRMGIGQHSRYADVLANYGLLGAIVLFWLTKRVYEYYKSISSKWSVEIIYFLIYIIYGIAEHNRNVGLMIMFCIMFPCLMILEGKRETNRIYR